MHGNAIAQRLMGLSAEERQREMFAAATGRLSYGEAREGMLAHAGWLSGAEGVRPGDRVALCLPKSLQAVQLVYGILATGAAYVPLQYQGPPARLSGILASLRPALFVTTIQMAAMIRSAGGPTPLPARTIEVDDDEVALAALGRGIPPRRTIADVSPLDLATISFTSGSTGDPKGVMWSQRGIEAATVNTMRRRQVTAADRLISLTGLHYTASREIFFPVISAARMYLCSDREMLIADQLAALLERQGTTIWASTATALRLLVEGGNLPTRNLRALRLVVIFGERMPVAALRRAMDAVPHAEFRNLYGATEAFDMIEYVVPRPLGVEVNALPLGQPSAAYELSLRDEAGRAVGPGEIGEICVVGPSVTIGYWNDPALSAAKRLAGVPDSFRTGDLATRGDDGLITLVGRKDHLVKLRGHRFDLGEIEMVAKSEPRVREAVAFTIGTATKAVEIVLAVLSNVAGDERIDLERELQRISRERLPQFARPGRVAIYGEFPLLSSGKVDRRALEKLVAPS